jgi:hypothetical protein
MPTPPANAPRRRWLAWAILVALSLWLASWLASLRQDW